MKRILDFTTAFFLLVLFTIPILFITLLGRLTSRGPVLYWSDRIGINNSVFRMPKFRTMKVDTPPVATHLLGNPASHLTPVGPIL